MMQIDPQIAAHLRVTGWAHDPSDGFIAYLGGVWWREGASGPVYGFLAGSQAVNRNGFVHGGMMMSFVDRVFGLTARRVSGAPRGATVSLNHQFMTPMKIGAFAELEPRVIRLTPRMAFLDGTLVCGDQPVVSAQGVWRLARTEA